MHGQRKTRQPIELAGFFVTFSTGFNPAMSVNYTAAKDPDKWSGREPNRKHFRAT